MSKDWHVREWMELLEKRQAGLVSDLGWTRRKASEVWNGDQQYKRDTVNAVADWLGIEPFELLLPPTEALRLRQMREAAFAIAADTPMAIAADRSRNFEGAKSPAKKR